MSMANSSTYSPTIPHFFQPLLPGFHSHLNIPMAFFSKHFEGTTYQGDAVVKLRSDASDLTWEVKMDGRRLTQGWQKFAFSHDLRVGDIVIFRHDGDLLFHDTAFGPSCCEIRYDGDDDDGVIQISSACVTASNLSKDILLNGEGKPWRLLLRPHTASGRVCIRGGWKSFCYANRRRANDLLTFKLLQTGTRPVLKLCSSSHTTRQYRLLTLTLTAYSVRSCKLCLPVTFVKANGIEKARKISLVDRHGIKKATSLKPADKYGRLGLGKEWIEFCEVNGVKTGDSFKLELIKEEEVTVTHQLNFCSKV